MIGSGAKSATIPNTIHFPPFSFFMFTMLLRKRRSLPITAMGLVCLSLGVGSTLAQNNLPATVNDGSPPEVQYPQTPLRFILQDYETVSGKRIVKDNQALDLPITIETVHNLTTNEEWLDFVERSLLLNGIALIPAGENILKAVNWRAGSTPTREGIQTYINDYEIPDGETVVNYIMKLEFITTDEAMRIFQEVTKNTGTPYAGITMVPDANVLVITENSLIVKQLIALQQKIDVQPDKVRTEVIQLLRAEATTVADAINEILSQQQDQGSSGTTRTRTNSTPAAPRTTARPGSTATAAPSPTGGPASTQPIVVYPDQRTNRLIVIGRPLDVAYVQELVKELDAEAGVKRFIKRSLRHVSVQLALPVLADALTQRADPNSSAQGGVNTSNLGGGRAGGNFGGNNRFGATGGVGGGRNNLGGSSFGGSNFGGSNFGGSNFGGRGGIGGGTSNLGGGGGVSGFGIQDSGPISVPIGKSTLLIADPKINTIIAAGPPEDLLLVDTILDEIDVKPRQVYISTIIGQVTLGNTVDWGIDLLHQVQQYDVGGRTVRSGGLFQTGSGGNIIDLDSLTGVDAFPKIAGLNYYGQIGDYVNAYLQALETTSRFEIISRPSIYLSNNRQGTIVSGQEIAVPSSTQSSLGGVSNAGLISNIQYRTIALSLDVVPLINSNDEVTLQVSQRNDTTSGSTNIQGTEVPNVNTQQLYTEVTVPNKSTIVLGGLITESRQDNKSGLPLMVHVPLLKHLFGSNEKEKNRQELLIFIQPHIVNDATDLVNANLEQTENNRVTRSALEFNQRETGVDVDPEEVGYDEYDDFGEEASTGGFWDRFRSGRR